MDFKPLFKHAQEQGIEALQVFLEESEKLDLEVFKGELEKHQMANTKSLSIMGIYNGKMGKVTTEVIDMNQMKDWVQSIKDSASLIESKDQVFIYEGDPTYPKIEGLYQEELQNTDVSKKIDWAYKLESLIAEVDPRIDISQSYYSEVNHRVIIQNSKGLNLEKRVNSAFVGGQAVAREDGDSRSAFDYVQSNVIEDFDLEKLANEISGKAVSLLGAKAIKSGNYEVVLTNNASASLLQAYVSMFSADSVQKGMSKLINKVNEQIANPLITILDDPFLAKSPKSGAFDDEGVSTSPKEMVSKGVLKGYLHNLKTAHKANTKSTGNGSKSGVAPSNFYIQKGDSNYDDLVKSMAKGLVITDLQGTHSGTNAISGDFSLQASGYYIEEGKIVKPVALITVAGNYLTMLNDVEAVGDDLKFGYGFIGSPSLKISSLAVSGE